MKGTARSAITLTQKRKLRWQAYKDPSMSKKKLQAWFHQTFGQSISASSVSEILSFRYSYLDIELPCQSQNNRKKNRRQHWPELEEQLSGWMMLTIQQQEQKKDNENVGSRSTKTLIRPITGRLIREKAQSLWKIIPEYQGKEVPSFSNCWIQRFRKRCEEKTWILTQIDNSVAENETREENEPQSLCSTLSYDNSLVSNEFIVENCQSEKGQLLDYSISLGTAAWEFDGVTNLDRDGFCPTGL